MSDSQCASVELLSRHVELWEKCWKQPNDVEHCGVELYQYAKVIVATVNSLQGEVADWLVEQIVRHEQEAFQDLDWCEMDPEWWQLYRDMVEYLDWDVE